MGQRTQLIVVEDVINEDENTGYRYVTAHHDQWGFGRPVIFDILALCSKLSTGSYLCPHDYERDAKDIDVYAYRTLLHHNYPLKDEVPGKSVNLNLNGKGNKEANKTAMDFVEMFDSFDNNNGGALLWIVHLQGSNYHTQTSVAYGCLLGGEDSENPFAGIVDAITYMKQTNRQIVDGDLIALIKSSFKYFELSLIDEDDSIKKIIANRPTDEIKE